MSHKLSRRSFLRGSLVLSAGVAALSACAPKPEPEAKPAAPTSAAQKAPAPAKDTKTIRVAVWTIADRMFMKDAALEYGDQQDGVDVKIDEVPYGESMKKALTGLATDTLQDVLYAPVRWGKYAAYKGVFLWLDDYINAKDPGMDDFFPASVDGASFDGKVYGLPHETNPGAYAVVYYNKDLLAEKGVEEPTDDWTVEDFPEMAAKIQDRDNNIFGTDWVPSRFYAYSSLARTFGGDLLSPDGKKWTFGTDEKSVEAAKWVWALRNQYDAGAMRAEMEGLSFIAGRVGMTISNIQSSGQILTGVGDKFEVGIVLAPQSKTGLHGYYAFVNSMCVSAKTKHAQEAYDCAMHITSPDWCMRAFIEQTHPSGRQSVWAAADKADVHPVWKRVGDWMAREKAPGHMPMPYNLRFEELVDKWSNVHEQLWFGEVGFEEGVNIIQAEGASVVDLARD